MPATCVEATLISPTCINATDASPACIVATQVSPAGLPELHIYDEDDVEVTLDEILSLETGTYTFRIVNEGTDTLELGTITVDDVTFSVTQPLVDELEPTEETTFTVTVPAA